MCVHVCVCMCMYVYACVVYMCVCMFVHVYQCVYMCNTSCHSEKLKEQLDAALDEKRKLRLIIHKYEAEFLEQHGR